MEFLHNAAAPAGEYNTGPEFTVDLVDNKTMAHRWGDIEKALRTAFEASDYVDAGYTINNPIEYTRAGIEGRLPQKVGHVLTLGDDDQVLGGIFCVPTERGEGQTACDVGWVFIHPDVRPRVRLGIMDAMMRKVFDTVAAAGFQRVITNMGTPAGAQALSRRYGIRHEPLAGQPNRWVRELS